MAVFFPFSSKMLSVARSTMDLSICNVFFFWGARNIATLNKHINAFRFLEMLIYKNMYILELGKILLVVYSFQKDFGIKLALPEEVWCLPLASCPRGAARGSTGPGHACCELAPWFSQRETLLVTQNAQGLTFQLIKKFWLNKGYSQYIKKFRFLELEIVINKHLIDT